MEMDEFAIKNPCLIVQSLEFSIQYPVSNFQFQVSRIQNSGSRVQRKPDNPINPITLKRDPLHEERFTPFCSEQKNPLNPDPFVFEILSIADLGIQIAVA
jgi:hypothetical protein